MCEHEWLTKLFIMWITRDTISYVSQDIISKKVMKFLNIYMIHVYYYGVFLVKNNNKILFLLQYFI